MRLIHTAVGSVRVSAFVQHTLKREPSAVLHEAGVAGHDCVADGSVSLVLVRSSLRSLILRLPR